MERYMMCAVMSVFALMAPVATVQAEEAQMRVQVADLNTHTAGGAEVAMNRIRLRVAVFCQANEGNRSLAVKAEVNRCVREMGRKAVTQLDAPLVTALYEGRPAPAETHEGVAIAAR